MRIDESLLLPLFHPVFLCDGITIPLYGLSIAILLVLRTVDLASKNFFAFFLDRCQRRHCWHDERAPRPRPGAIRTCVCGSHQDRYVPAERAAR